VPFLPARKLELFAPRWPTRLPVQGPPLPISPQASAGWAVALGVLPARQAK
jgi:hypothetical protein